MQIIKNPWDELFKELVQSAKEKIYCSSPFIKWNVARIIIDNKNKNIDCKILTKFTLPNVRWGWLDLDAIQVLIDNNISIKNISNLHAKIFIFDSNVIITSANLTNWWLINNLEYWILLKDWKEIENDFLNYFNDKNYNLIKEKDIFKLKDIVSGLPEYKNFENNDLDWNEVFLEDINIVKSKLSNWNLLTYNCINEIWKKIFTTSDINRFANRFNWKTPENTIRRNLQELRDLWLLEFVDYRWTYKKLWI